MKLVTQVLVFLLVIATRAFAQTDQIPLNQITFVGPGGDLGATPITTGIAHVDLGLGGVESRFDKREGPNRWPDNITPGWQGPLQYSTGMVIKVNGRWFASAPIETWFGNNVVGGQVQSTAVTCDAGVGQVACNWFYDARWADLKGQQPPAGAQFGLFVVAGDPRNSFTPVKERSNIVLVTMPASGVAAAFDFQSAPADHGNHTDTVAQVKADLVAKHVDLSGPCGAFEITRRVAWALRSIGAGLLSKDVGNNCTGFAVDIVAFPDGVIFDMLVNAETDNTPAWNNAGQVPVERYRQPSDPGDAPGPGPGPGPTPDLTALTQRVGALETIVNSITANFEQRIEELGKEFDNFIATFGDRLTANEKAVAEHALELVKERQRTCNAVIRLGVNIPISCKLSEIP